MQAVNDLLKINALLCLALGSLLVFLPDVIIQLLSEHNNTPLKFILFSGVFFNIYGLLNWWLARFKHIPNAWTQWVIIVNFLVAGLIAVLIVLKLWIESINGMTASGLISIALGWLAFLLKQHLKK